MKSMWSVLSVTIPYYMVVTSVHIVESVMNVHHLMLPMVDKKFKEKLANSK